MPEGFFHISTLAQSKAPAYTVAQCGQCGLYKGCHSPKMPWTGEGRLGVLVIGEAPGEKEDEQNVQLIGPAGQRLRTALRRIGVDLDRDCWKTNTLICRPPDNETPTDDQIEWCRPNLNDTLAALKPRVIIPMGGIAVKALIQPLWREEIGPMARWAGWQIPCQKPNAWICPTWHPSYLLRAEDEVLDLWWQRHLTDAFELEGRPWPDTGPPDFKGQVECHRDPNVAARILRQMVAKGGPTAFDYETNCLKPDGPKAAIYSCAVCWRGRRTIAYPWAGEAIKATQEYLASPLPKIASNQKFEQRWSIKEFGHGARAWAWDTMLAAHAADSREGITSIKFQSFVRRGHAGYSSHIDDLLKAENSRALNRIKEVELGDLLLYNGLDALLEYDTAAVQMDDFGLRMPE